MTAQLRRGCCFCGGGPLSGEHLWPAWAGPILPRSAGRDYIALKRVWGDAPIVESVRRKQGALVEDRARVVCTACNNGWMNRIEQAARPSVERMILGRETSLAQPEASRLTRWVTLKAMIIDRHRSREHVFTEDELKRFHDVHKSIRTFDGALEGIPQRLEIALFRCGEGRWTNALGVDRVTMSNVDGVKPSRVNVGLFVWGLGQLLISMIYRDGVRFPLPVTQDSEIELWPLVTAATWPRERRLTEPEATKLEAALSHMTKWPGAQNRSGSQTDYGDMNGPAQWLRPGRFDGHFGVSTPALLPPVPVLAYSHQLDVDCQ